MPEDRMSENECCKRYAVSLSDGYERRLKEKERELAASLAREAEKDGKLRSMGEDFRSAFNYPAKCVSIGMCGYEMTDSYVKRVFQEWFTTPAKSPEKEAGL
jgi:hypothetical protein